MKPLMGTIAAAAATAILAACGGGELVVQAAVQNAEGQPTPIRELPVRALPYDREVVFDSLRKAYGTPEPAVPAELTALRDSIAIANQQWSAAEATWGAGRDSLRILNDQLRQIPRMSPQYLPLFNRFSALEGQVRAAEQTSKQAFARFTELQNRYSTGAEEVRLAREQWADAAYADVDQVIAARLKELRRGEVVDTTDANGVARFRGLKSGQWWIHARYDLPFEELYWNVPVEPGREDVQVQLTRETAQVRPKL